MYTLVRGPPRRVFDLQHDGLSADDVRIYQRVIALAAAGHPFVYDPPDSGDVVVHRIAMDDETNWQSSPGTKTTLAEGYDPDGSPCIQHQADSSGLMFLTQATSLPNALFTAAEDWTDKYIRFDFRAKDTNGWLTQGGGQVLGLVLFQGGSTTRWTRWELGDLLFQNEQPAIDEWVRLWVDPNSTARVTADSANGGVDLAAVTGLEFIWTADSSSDKLQVCNFMLVEKRKRPAVVNLVRHSIVQDSQIPSALPTYQVRLQMVESLA